MLVTSTLSGKKLCPKIRLTPPFTLIENCPLKFVLPSPELLIAGQFVAWLKDDWLKKDQAAEVVELPT